MAKRTTEKDNDLPTVLGWAETRKGLFVNCDAVHFSAPFYWAKYTQSPHFLRHAGTELKQILRGHRAVISAPQFVLDSHTLLHV